MAWASWAARSGWLGAQPHPTMEAGRYFAAQHQTGYGRGCQVISAELSITFDEVQGSVAPPIATPTSCLREVMGHAFVGAALLEQSRRPVPLVEGSP